MIYFTSDLHFGHANIIRYENRPFSSTDEMDRALVARWNARVKPEDTVYILGDVSWYGADKTVGILKSLNGKKVLIRGNHDDYWLNGDNLRLFEAVYDYREIKVGGRPVVLSHYPIPFYNRQHKGAVMLYGHVHTTREWNIIESLRRDLQRLGIPCHLYNVGCMVWNFEPVTLEEILADPRFQPEQVENP